MISMSAISFSNELDVILLLQIIVDVQSIYSENKLFFDLFSELVVLMPSTVDKINAIEPIINIQVYKTHCINLLLNYLSRHY